MQAQIPEALWLHAPAELDATELAHACGMSEADIVELVTYGALAPERGTAATAQVFSAATVPALRHAAQLRSDYDLDVFTVGLLLGYLQRINQLEQQVRSLQAVLPHPLHPPPREGPGLWREPHA